MEFKELSQGFAWEDSGCLVFFGNATFKKENFAELFPRLSPRFVKQVHGRSCIESQAEENLEADAHWTEEEKLALCINSADCLPIMVLAEDKALAIHAGWRGLAQQLIKSSLDIFTEPLAQAQVFIGPHISAKTFEMGRETAEELCKNSGVELPESFHFDHPDPSKRYVDLLAIAKSQLLSKGCHSNNIHCLAIDTMSDKSWNSFRRDGEKSGRNISFCALK